MSGCEAVGSPFCCPVEYEKTAYLVFGTPSVYNKVWGLCKLSASGAGTIDRSGYLTGEAKFFIGHIIAGNHMSFSPYISESVVS